MRIVKAAAQRELLRNYLIWWA